MRRSPLASTLLTLVLAATLACEKKQSTQEPGAASDGAPTGTAPKADTIRLGLVGSLTGDQATFGISTRNGVMLAVEEANAAGGVKGKTLEVRVYDSQGKPAEAANAVTRLISQDNVVAILGDVASSNSLAMAPRAQAAGVPMITPSSTNPKVTEVGDYVFRVCFIDPFQGAVMARFARDNLKLDRVAVLLDNKSDYSIGLATVFVPAFKEQGGTIVGEEAYSQGDTDFRAQLTSIKAKNPQAIYVPGYYTDVGLIARQARQLGLKVPLLGADGWESEKLYELGGSALEGSYFSNHYSPEDPRPQVQDFIKKYKAKYGAVPDSLAVLGYDAAKVAIAALGKAENTTGPVLRDAIKDTRDFPGVGGTITIDEKRNAQKPAAILQVQSGTAKFITSVAP